MLDEVQIKSTLWQRVYYAILKFNPVSSEKLEEMLLAVHCHIFKMTLSELAQVIHKIWRVIYMKVSERNFQRGRKVTALKAWLDNDIYGKQQKQRQKQQQQGWIEEYFRGRMRFLMNWISGWVDIPKAFQRYPWQSCFFLSLWLSGARLCPQPVICYWPPFLQQST